MDWPEQGIPELSSVPWLKSALEDQMPYQANGMWCNVKDHTTTRYVRTIKWSRCQAIGGKIGKIVENPDYLCRSTSYEGVP